MKKSLLALAVLGAFAGAASAQSSVTLYGKLDQAVGKATGSADKQLRDGASSRVGIKGQEDLGGGLKAVFGFEHRFSPDTGKDATAENDDVTKQSTLSDNRMWNGYSTVGLGGSFGTVNLGRQYTSSFSLAQNVFDPFGGDTVAGLRDTALRVAPARMRVDNSIRYDGVFGGVKIAADIAERTTGTNRPYSVAAQYAAGPVLAAISYENPEGADDNLLDLGVAYSFGPAKLALAGSSGKTAANAKTRGYLIGATVNVGTSGRFLAGYAVNKLTPVTGAATTAKKASIGYRHDLSKRTFLYTDFTRTNEAAILGTTPAGDKSQKTGYDFGVQHNF